MNKIKKQFKIQLFFVFVLSFCISGTVYSQIYDWTLFANDYANGANIISLNSPIIAGGNIGEFSGDKLSIDGNHNLIDGNGNSGFSFSGKRVSFENLIFKGFGSIVVHDDQYWGGALFADSGSNISFTGDLIEFSSNFATATDGASAGALFIGYTDGAQTIVNFQDVNVNFLGNIAKANGGAIHSYEDSSLSFSGTDKTVNFEKNTSVADNYRGGGAIYTIGGDNRQALIYFNDISSVNFIRNFSGKDGGAIFEGVYSNIEFNNSIIDFSFNTAQSSGGAIYIDNGSIMTISGLAKFTNNKAQTGGAIFIDNAQLNIIANKGDFLFENNQSDNGIDIYMKGVSKLSLNADNNNIIMKGGINGEKDSSIIKEGDGNWILSGSNKYEGSIDIQKGGFILYKAQSVQLSSLTIGAGAKFSMADDSIMSKIYAGNLTINGTYEVDLSLESLEADITSASYISIGNGAKIKIFSNLASSDLKAGNILLLYAQNGTTGSFNNLNYVYLGKGFGYSWIQDNNALYMSLTSGTVPNIPIPSDIDDSGRAVINALNNLDTYNEDLLFLKDYLYQSILAGTYDYDGQTITNQVSGKFMANILSLSLINKDYNSAIYSKINESKEVSNDISKAIWVQGIMSGSKYESAKEPSKFQNDSFGVQAGFNFLASRDFVAGAYAGYESNKAKQGDNKADINEIQLGLYGGYFDSWFNIRFILAGARQNFSVNRQISVTSTLIKTQSDFDTFNISAGFEAEFPIWLNSTFDLKPFIGANGGLASNPEIKEKGGTGVTIQSGDYSRLSTVFGVKLAANMQKANLYAKVYGEYTAVGNEPKYNIYLTANPLDKWEELGDKIDPLLLGAGIGFDWNFTDNFTLSINADLNTNSDLLRYFANLGITYKFGSKASNEIASAIEQDEVQYVKEPEILTADFESANEDYPNASSDSRQQYYPIEDDSEAISSAQTTIASAQDSDSSETPIAIAPQAPIKPPVVAAVAKKPKINKINLRKKTPEELEEDRLEREEFSDLPKSPEDRAMENLLDTKSSVELDQMTDEELLAAVDEESEKFKKPLAKKVDLLVANFKDNAVELTKEVKETVKKLAENLKQYAFKKITVEGHSDSKGGVRNFLTSRLRARAVYAELREQGIPADKIEYKGVGSQKPVASNKTAYGQQENRRVELVVE